MNKFVITNKLNNNAVMFGAKEFSSFQSAKYFLVNYLEDVIATEKGNERRSIGELNRLVRNELNNYRLKQL